MAELSYTHRYIPSAKADAPTLLMLHGTGGTEHDLIEIGKTLRPDANLLSPRGKVSENGMARFFRRLSEGVFDEEDLRFRTHELADFIRDAAAEYNFDAQKIVAVGYSNGANIAATMMLLRPEVLRGAILL
ncbi:MAG TPA: alpha/beta hydrolase, partial [Abditibacteriaceae bacterium]